MKEIICMFTDWSQTDPKYFYLRGFMLGVIGTISFGTFIYNWLKNEVKK